MITIRKVGHGQIDILPGHLRSTLAETITAMVTAEISLSGADLSGVNLTKANLRKANLSGADLTEANLSGADLTDVNLEGASRRDRGF